MGEIRPYTTVEVKSSLRVRVSTGITGDARLFTGKRWSTGEGWRDARLSAADRRNRREEVGESWKEAALPAPIGTGSSNSLSPASGSGLVLTLHNRILGRIWKNEHLT